MGAEVLNKNKDCEFHGDYVGHDQNITNIILFQDNEREFVVTHNADIKPVSYFTGRETELQDLRLRIEEGRKSVLVSGMGGIGKTHICRKLFEEYYDKHDKYKDELFKHIGYIEYDGNMDNSLKNCLKFKEQEDPKQNQKAAWRELEYLASNGKFLLFVDNVNVSMGEDPSLKRLTSMPGAIVITSRRRVFSKAFEPYRIGFLSTGKCREIYEKIRFENSGKRIELDEETDLEYIINTLAARHTITVEFLAHLAWTKNWTVKKLREELEDNGFQLEYRDDEDKLVNIQKSYETLYDLSVLTAAEQNILEAFSVFPYIPLDAETCNLWLLEDAGVSEDDDILNMLYRKGWLQYDAEQNSYSMHPVFAQFIYDKCKPVLKKHLELVNSCQEYLKIPENGSVLECQKYISVAESMIEGLGIGENLEKISFLSTVAELHKYIADYKKAEALYKRFLKISEKELGEEHSYTAAGYNNLALVYADQGEYRKAEELCEKGLQIRERMLGEEHPDTATSYNNLALVYADQGEYKKAEELHEKSLRIRKKVLGEEHLYTAISYNNLALVYADQGEYKKAEELHEKSLRIREKVLGEEHPYIATGCNNLAQVYELQGKYKKAEGLYEKSLRIRKKVFGEKHPVTAIGYHNLAVVYTRQGKYKKAEELHEKSLRIRKKVFGEEHPDTARSYNNLAGVYMRQGEYKKAEELYEKGLRIREKVLGEEHPDTAMSYHDLAEAYARRGEYKKAEELHEKGLRIRERVLGEEHSDTAMSYHNVAGVYAKQGEHKKAKELHEKGLRIRERVLGGEHPDTAMSYHNVAKAYASQGEYKKAEELHKKGLRIEERVLGEENLDITTGYNNLAGVYVRQGEYKKAEELHKKNLRIREKVLGEGNPKTAISYHNLAGAYMGQGKYELALSYLIKAYKIFINKLGLEHPNTKMAYQHMERTYKAWDSAGDFEQWLKDKMKE